MKVLHVVPSVSPIRGGSTVAVLETVRSLLDCGVAAEIVTTNDSGATLLDVPLYQTIEFEGVPVTFFPRFSPRSHAVSEFAISLEHSRWLWQHIREYDLVEINSLFSYVCTASGWIARQRQVPYVISPHGHFAPWVIQQKRAKKQIYNTLFEQGNLDRAAGIHCTTTAEAKNVKHFGIKAPTFTIPLGVTIPPPVANARQQLCDRYGIPADVPIILFLSRFHAKKRPDFLLEVLHQLKDQQPFHLILAGDGEADYVQYVKAQVEHWELCDRTTLPGFLRGEDKAMALYGADVFALPSYGENFGIAVAEAMGAGLPVVITPEVEIADDVQTANAGLVVPGELPAWQSALATLLQSVDQRHRLGHNGRKLSCDRYNWATVGQQLKETYASILHLTNQHE
ncbi:MAG: glycosyltransferase [Thainema sp.]